MLAVESIQQALPQVYTLQAERTVIELRTYYDTFDWQLYDKSLLLCRSDMQYTLLSLDGLGRSLHSHAPEAAAFGVELPNGRLREMVDSATAPRALMDRAIISVGITINRVLNDDEKTIARLVQLSVVPDDEVGDDVDGRQFLYLQPLRGYEKAAKRISSALADILGYVGDPIEAEVQLFQTTMKIAGQVPGDYSSKLDVALSPEMRSDEATRIILRRLLDVMRANEDGIRQDIDTEFLHDYRVAVRRTRSALSQIRDVFPADVTEHYQSAFRTLGQCTNALRDLDVYLLAEPAYRRQLPEILQDDIAPLFDYMRVQRKAALDAVIACIDSPQTNQMLTEWDEFLGYSSNGAGAINAAVPVLILSQGRIYRRYAHILKRGRKLLDNAEDKKLHALRIDCKKLRYLLEFFACLYPARKVHRLISDLKTLQSNLGDFNDLSVQQEYLMAMAKAMPLDAPSTGLALVATGALVATMAQRQAVVKSEFADRFRKFASPANEELYRELFTVSVSYSDDA